MSTRNVRDLTTTSPSASTTRTRNVCAPSARPLTECESPPEHGPNAVSESSEHDTTPPVAAKPNLVLLPRRTSPSAGPETMSTVGHVTSSVKRRVSVPVFPRSSVAVTETSLSPSPLTVSPDVHGFVTTPLTEHWKVPFSTPECVNSS